MYRRGNCKGNCLNPHRDCLCNIDKETEEYCKKRMEEYIMKNYGDRSGSSLLSDQSDLAIAYRKNIETLLMEKK